MTYDELDRAGFVLNHHCSGCGAPVGSMIHPDMAAAVYQSGCDCGGPYPNYRLLTRQELSALTAQEPRHD